MLDDRRETTSASARITPQRHFSQIICRTEAVQLCAASAGVPGVVRVTALSAGAAGLAGDDPGAAAGAAAGVTFGVAARVEVTEDAGVEEAGAGEVPRSFCAMFGTSRIAGVQYCEIRCISASLDQQTAGKSHRLWDRKSGARWDGDTAKEDGPTKMATTTASDCK